MWSLDDLNVYDVVIAEASFAAASRRLGMTRSAVSKAIRRLEDQLEAQLFVRSTRALQLTDAGHIFHGSVQGILTAVRRAERMIADQKGEAAGVVKLSAPVSLGLQHLAAWVPQITRTLPRVEMDLMLTDRVIHIVEEGLDFAIRVVMVGHLPDSQLRVSRLATGTMRLCASPDYLERRPNPETPADLQEHDCLLYTHQFGPERIGVWRFVRDGEEIDQAITPRLRFDSGPAIRQATLGGAGVAMMPGFMVREDIDRGALIEVLPDIGKRQYAIVALRPDTTYLAPAVRAVLNTLTERFQELPT
ncbi:MAG: LysR family transcriptional regulator [Myxococcota bacterium]